MAKLKPGDRVDCKVKDSSIVSPYKDYDEIMTFEIIAVESYGLYLYVPPYRTLKGTLKADAYKCRDLGIQKRFQDVEYLYISDNLVFKINSILDGMRCKKCDEFCFKAGANQDDGTLICYTCRESPYR